MQISTEGIVLKQRKITGNRALIVIFTRDYGKITAGTSITMRSKSKAALALRPFTLAEYNIFKGREYYNIDSAQVKRSYYSIGEDIDRFAAASRLIEYLDAILEDGQKRPRLFDLTCEFLDSIARMKAEYSTLLYAFIVKTFKLQGIMPELSRCVNCSGDLDNSSYFSIEAGGMLCNECAKRIIVYPESLIFKPSFDIINTLSYLERKPLSHFERVALKPEIADELQRIIESYLKYYLEVDLFEGDELEWLK